MGFGSEVIYSLVMALSFNLEIGRVEGSLIFGCLVIFIIYTYYLSKKIRLEFEEIDNNNGRLKQIIFIIFGIIGLSIGADIFIDKSIYFAKLFGISELVIGISAVVIGTSLPELTASVIAIRIFP